MELFKEEYFENEETEIDIFKGVYKKDLSAVDENCDCYVCKNFTPLLEMPYGLLPR